jgi:hypothetical protein
MFAVFHAAPTPEDACQRHMTIIWKILLLLLLFE